MNNDFGIEAETTVKLGYIETLCITCENAAGSKTQHDNWLI